MTTLVEQPAVPIFRCAIPVCDQPASAWYTIRCGNAIVHRWLCARCAALERAYRGNDCVKEEPYDYAN